MSVSYKRPCSRGREKKKKKKKGRYVYKGQGQGKGPEGKIESNGRYEGRMESGDNENGGGRKGVQDACIA